MTVHPLVRDQFQDRAHGAVDRGGDRFAQADPRASARRFTPDDQHPTFLAPEHADHAEHDVRLHQIGTKHFRHPVVGLLDGSFDSMPLPAREDQDLTMTCYTAEPGSPSEDALKLLASWAATATPREDIDTGGHAR